MAVFLFAVGGLAKRRMAISRLSGISVNAQRDARAFLVWMALPASLLAALLAQSYAPFDALSRDPLVYAEQLIEEGAQDTAAPIAEAGGQA